MGVVRLRSRSHRDARPVCERSRPRQDDGGAMAAMGADAQRPPAEPVGHGHRAGRGVTRAKARRTIPVYSRDMHPLRFSLVLLIALTCARFTSAQAPRPNIIVI